MRVLIFGLLPAFFVFAGEAQANDAPPIDYPGSVWSATGLQSPVESGNVSSQTHVEQGVRFRLDDDTAIVPFVTGDVAFDTDSFDWNNYVRGSAGVKLEQLVGDNGVVALRSGYAVEHLFESNVTRAEPFVQGEYWLGWNNADKTLPGSSWGAISYNLPAEKDNLLGVAYIEQAYRLYREDGWSLLPFAAVTLSGDTRGQDWNNYVRGAIGAKVGLNSCSCDLAVAYVHEERFKSNRSADGVMVSLRLWFGWNLK